MRSSRVRALRPSEGLPSVRHERLHGGAATREENMKLISKAELWRVNDRRRDQLTAEIRRKIGAADLEIRKGYAELANIRQAQKQRPVMRPNL
jgi:hypothetical protein